MKKLTPILVLAGAAGIAATVMMFQCGYRPGEPPHLLKASDLTPKEIKFGRAPQRDRSVVYQPDVVVMENGTNAIRSLTSDGFGCVIDARARHVKELTVGKIAFVSGRCVGRILYTKREGDALTVILGPVELTDIFSKLDVTVDQPIDFAQAIEYPTLQLPQMTLPLEGPDSAPPSFDSASRARDLSDIHAPNFVPAALAFWQVPGSAGILPDSSQSWIRGYQAAQQLGWYWLRTSTRGPRHSFGSASTGSREDSTPRIHLGINNKDIDAKIVLHNAAGFETCL